MTRTVRLRTILQGPGASEPNFEDIPPENVKLSVKAAQFTSTGQQPMFADKGKAISVTPAVAPTAYMGPVGEQQQKLQEAQVAAVVEKVETRDSAAQPSKKERRRAKLEAAAAYLLAYVAACADLLRSKVISRISHPAGVVDCTVVNMRKLKVAVGAALRKKVAKRRSPGLLLSLPVKGHALDPVQHLRTRALNVLSAVCSYLPALWQARLPLPLIAEAV